MLIRTFAFICIFTLTLSGCSVHSPHIAAPKEIPPAKPLEKVDVALVLGGGGARGVAHAGVISVLEQNNIPIDFIVGTSIGSVVGALYADDPNSEHLKAKIMKVKLKEIIDWSFYSSLRMIWGVSGFADGHGLRNYLSRHLTATDFDDLKIPLAVVTTDIEKGEVLVLRSGPIIPASHASSAVPVVFTPVSLYDRMLVDGAVVSPVPVEIAKELGAKKIIAVDIGAVVKPRHVRGTYDLTDRSLWLSYMALTKWENELADVVIQPDFETTSMFDDSQLEAYYEAGRRAALEALPQIKRMLAQSDDSAKG